MLRNILRIFCLLTFCHMQALASDSADYLTRGDIARLLRDRITSCRHLSKCCLASTYCCLGTYTCGLMCMGGAFNVGQTLLASILCANAASFKSDDFPKSWYYLCDSNDPWDAEDLRRASEETIREHHALLVHCAETYNDDNKYILNKLDRKQTIAFAKVSVCDFLSLYVTNRISKKHFDWCEDLIRSRASY